MSSSIYAEKIVIKIVKANDKAIVPTYAMSGCAGLDLYSADDVKIPAGSRTIINTGIKMELPEGIYARIAPRSGLAAKCGLHIGAGVIDPSYRGEVCVVLFNLGADLFCVYRGLKIAQMIIEKYYVAEMKVVKTLGTTVREEKGFGSTDN